MSSTLFQKLLGAPFFRLPDSVRALHSVRGEGRYAGRATIARGRNPIARLCAAVVGLPPSVSDVPTTVDFRTDATGETWQRSFGSHRLRSRLRAHDGLLRERLGPVQFRFALHVSDGAIWWQTVGVRVFGVLPLPVSWFADVRCREREHEGRYEFLVEASLPLVGPLIRYEGWLEPV
ncbi:MAG TPA: DUF4166 domain-containing protein [Luteimonas sp.]|nr:DUF4166 domain-containing protein [Luteimonas sp.]